LSLRKSSKIIVISEAHFLICLKRVAINWKISGEYLTFQYLLNRNTSASVTPHKSLKVFLITYFWWKFGSVWKWLCKLTVQKSETGIVYKLKLSGKYSTY